MITINDRYLDCAASVSHVGHSHPRLLQVSLLSSSLLHLSFFESLTLNFQVDQCWSFSILRLTTSRICTLSTGLAAVLMGGGVELQGIGAYCWAWATILNQKYLILELIFGPSLLLFGSPLLLFGSSWKAAGEETGFDSSA